MIGKWWGIYIIGDLKMYEYNDDTQVLDRLMLLLLIEPRKFLDKMKEKIKASSLQTQLFFQIIEEAINSDLVKYMILCGIKDRFILNDDVVNTIVITWIKVVMGESVQ